MGQAVIKQHIINNVKYDPYGFFSRTKDDESGLQIPFNDEEDGAIIDDFRSDFNLRRNDESGLSIVIPFLSETESTIRAEDIVRAVIKHYFYPIISDNLTVEISDATRKWHLKSDNIKDVVSQIV